MNEALNAVDYAIREVNKLRQNLKKKKKNQIRSNAERTLVKATALSWLNNHRAIVTPFLDQESVESINRLYADILQACDRATGINVYERKLKIIAEELISIKGGIVLTSTKEHKSTPETPPDFSLFTSDIQMQTILINRWQECYRCIVGNAPLAATVMMGGFLESLLLTRINKETDKSKIFKASSAPKDSKSGSALSLKDWTLRGYIDVAHELKWISQSVKEVGEVLRDFRNYIHPYKQITYNVNLSQDDAKLFWEITKSISRQLLH